MKKINTGKWKILIIFGTLFLAVCILLLLIFYQGKKTYTVTFDLDEGTLISGSLEQRITQGQDAVPPTVVKDGAYLRGWSTSYKNITKNVVIKALWEYTTTAGIIYADVENQNFTEIIGSHPYLYGEVYLGAYFNDQRVLGIGDDVFANRTGITKVYLLDGLISIGDRAFAGCTALTEIEIPETVTYLGEDAFLGCESLETLELNEGLQKIGDRAFAGCSSLKGVSIPSTVTSLGTDAFRDCEALEILVLNEGALKIGAGAFANCENLVKVIIPEGVISIDAGAFENCKNLTEIVLPESVNRIAAGAFAGCDNLIITVNFSEDEKPPLWANGWQGDAQVNWADDSEQTPEDVETTENSDETTGGN